MTLTLVHTNCAAESQTSSHEKPIHSRVCGTKRFRETSMCSNFMKYFRIKQKVWLLLFVFVYEAAAGIPTKSQILGLYLNSIPDVQTVTVFRMCLSMLL